MCSRPDTDLAAGSPALQPYRALERLCERMLEFARQGAWDEADRVDRSVRTAIDTIRRRADLRELSPLEHREKLRILRRIVRIDAELRHLEHPWQRDLDAMLAVRL